MYEKLEKVGLFPPDELYGPSPLAAIWRHLRRQQRPYLPGMVSLDERIERVRQAECAAVLPTILVTSTKR